jgi:uncharacterized protein YciI
MMRRYAYFYFMKAEPERVRAVAPSHAAHWHGLRLSDYLGGPFSDRRGGLITFQTDDDAEAERAVAGDPFLKEGLLEEHWLKEWVIE